MFKIKILPIPRRALNCLLHESRVLRMNPLQDKLNGRYRASVILEDSKGFFGPDEFACRGPPAKAPGATEPLSLLQVLLASFLGALTSDKNAACILQGNRSQ